MSCWLVRMIQGKSLTSPPLTLQEIIIVVYSKSMRQQREKEMNVRSSNPLRYEAGTRYSAGFHRPVIFASRGVYSVLFLHSAYTLIHSSHSVYYLICLIWTISMDQSLWDEWFLKYSVTSKLQSVLFSLWQNTAALLSFKAEQMLHVHWGHTLWFSKNTLLQIIFHLFLGMLTTTAGAIYKFRSEFGQHITRVTTTRCHYRQ